MQLSFHMYSEHKTGATRLGLCCLSLSQGIILPIPQSYCTVRRTNVALSRLLTTWAARLSFAFYSLISTGISWASDRWTLDLASGRLGRFWRCEQRGVHFAAYHRQREVPGLCCLSPSRSGKYTGSAWSHPWIYVKMELSLLLLSFLWDTRIISILLER